MELKHRPMDIEPFYQLRSNRTFMELKLLMETALTKRRERSNRTFMELKPFKSLSSILNTMGVLIVPLWN